MYYGGLTLETFSHDIARSKETNFDDLLGGKRLMHAMF